jgi:hypothetical protein
MPASISPNQAMQSTVMFNKLGNLSQAKIKEQAKADLLNCVPLQGAIFF